MAFELTKGYIDLTTRTSRFDRAMSGVRSRLTGVGNKITEVTARAAKMFAVAATGYAAMSLKAYASFEEQLAKVSTMLDEQSMRYMPNYENAVKKMSVTFGEGTKTIADGLYDILSASIAPTQALDTLAVAMKAAKAGMTDTKTAADVLTTILNSYGLSADRATYVSDILFAVVKRGKTEFGLLAPHIGKVASLAATAGLSLEEFGAAIATLTRGGIRARIAMSGIKAILNTIIKSSTAGKEARAIMAKYGVSLDTATLRAIGLTGILQKLRRATVEELAVLMPAVPSINAFAVGLKQAEKQADDLRLMLNSAGLTQEAYNKMTDISAHKTRKWWQSTKMVATTVGKILTPAYLLLVEALTKTNIKLTEFIERRGPSISRWSERVAAKINFVRRMFVGIAKYVVSDFPAAWRFGLDSVVEIIKAAGQSILTIWEKVTKEMSNLLRGEFARAIQEIVVRIDTLWQRIKYGKVIGEDIVAARMREWERTRKPLQPTETWTEIGLKILEIQKEALARIADKIPPELTDLWQTELSRLTKKLAEIDEKYAKQRNDIVAASEDDRTKKQIDAAQQQVRPALAERAAAPLFAGLKEAWFKLAEAAAQKEAVQVQLATLDVAKETRRELHRSNRERRSQLNDIIVESRKEKIGQGALAM